MSDILIQKRVKVVYEDHGVQTRTGTLISLDANYVWIINDFTGREQGIPHSSVKKIEGISDKSGVEK